MPQGIATGLTRLVLLIQAALLGMLWLDPSQPPGQFGSFGEAMWALGHQPSFYPLAAAIVVGIPASIMVWVSRASYRPWLFVGWAVTITLIGVYHAPKVAAMLRILWWRYA